MPWTARSSPAVPRPGEPAHRPGRHRAGARSSATPRPAHRSPIERVRRRRPSAPTSDLRARRPARAEPAVGPARPVVRRLRPTRRRAARRPRAAGIVLDASPVDPPAPGRGAAAADLRRGTSPCSALRHHRPGRPPDDAAAPLPLRSAWTGGRGGRPRAVAGAQPRRPFLAAAFARAPARTPGSRPGSTVDPARTGFDDRLLHGDDPVAAYAASPRVRRRSPAPAST